jgi:hypothetical protein
MIVLKHCGQTYRADEKHIGYSIRCNVCSSLIPIVRETPDSALSTREQPTVEHIPPEPVRPWEPPPPLKSRRFLIRNWLIPVVGLLALALGVTLTLLSYRSPKNDALASQASTIVTPTPQSNLPNLSAEISPTPATSMKLQSATPEPSTTPSAARTSDSDPLGIDQFLANNPTSAPTVPPETVRYPTGTNLVRPRSANGRGVLRISNGTNSDAIAKLADAETSITVRLVYIQANSDGEIGNISPGNYILKFALGTGYNEDSGRFLYAQSFAKFVDILEFREYRLDDEIRWSDFDVSLNPVFGGTARTSTISAAEFYR